MTEAKKSEAGVPRYIQFLGRTHYQNVTFAPSIIDPKAYSLTSNDIAALVGAGQARALSDAEADAHEGIDEERAVKPESGHVPLENRDIVVQKIAGKDVAWDDPRVQGPNEPPPGERDQKVTRLPPGDVPTGTPLGVQQAAHSIGGKKGVVKTDAPEPLPPRNENEASTTLPQTTGVDVTTDDAEAKRRSSHKK